MPEVAPPTPESPTNRADQSVPHSSIIGKPAGKRQQAGQGNSQAGNPVGDNNGEKHGDWFKAGLGSRIVRLSYVISACGSLVTTGILLAEGANVDAIRVFNVPFLSLLLVTLLYHYKLGKRLPF